MQPSCEPASLDSFWQLVKLGLVWWPLANPMLQFIACMSSMKHGMRPDYYQQGLVASRYKAGSSVAWEVSQVALPQTISARSLLPSVFALDQGRDLSAFQPVQSCLASSNEY